MAEYQVENVGDIAVAKGADTPKPALQVTDSAGGHMDLDTQVADARLEVIPLSYVGEITTLETYVIEDDVITFTWGQETATPGSVRTVLHLDLNTDGSLALFAPTYIVYDPAQLWANPADVKALVEGSYTDSQVIRAILFAESIVRAWVSVPIQSPVPETIRQATTLLAARALTIVTGSGVPGHSGGRIVSETIADYTVRYADPGAIDEGGLGVWITPEIAALLAPYHGNVYDVVVGPANRRSPLPVTLRDWDWWWGDAVIYDEVIP